MSLIKILTFLRLTSSIVEIPLSKLQQERRTWDPAAWATAVVLAFFVAKLGRVSADWELLADKSKSWLNENHENITEAMFEKALSLFPS
ncbi:unnamed protein product [Allacma fusca]|uniref:Uncharacterized protein n=1 Tax=Allacma fusca TaxID=39272 RepID=A0A8J2JTN0_9HEXA|nr:unnamed protein product [Allacma fusca]